MMLETVKLINQAIVYLERHLCAPVSIEQAAAAAGYSRSHFSRTFARLTGLTPAGYLRKRRLSAAAHELIHSPKRILEIALDYQFQSQEAFTRSFQQEFGVNPGGYRRQRRLGQLLQRIKLGFSNLLYPGKGIHQTPPIFVPERPLLAVILVPDVHSGGYAVKAVAPTPPPLVKIRLAHRQDTAALCRLYHELHQFTVRQVPERLRSLDNAECFAAAGLGHTLDRLSDAVAVSLWVAEVKGEVVGLAEVYLREEEQNAATLNRYGYLQSLVVAPRWRSRGIGRQLLAAAETWSKTQGAHELRLDTWEVDPAPFHFYTQQGYRTLRRTLVRPL